LDRHAIHLKFVGFLSSTEQGPVRLAGPAMVGSFDNLAPAYWPVAWWCALMVPAYLVATAVLRFGVGLPPGLKLERLAGYVGMYPFFVAMVYYSHAGCWTHWSAGLDRVNESDANCNTFVCLYIASNIIAAIGQARTESGTLLWQLMAHHALSIFCFGTSYYFDRYWFYCAFAGVCETTNLFLVPVFASKEIPWIKAQGWFKVNSVLLMVTFIVHRFVLFPVWLYMWFTEPQPADMHPVEKYMYPCVMLFVLLLSCAWFSLLVKGFIKLFTPGYFDKEGKHKGKIEKDF